MEDSPVDGQEGQKISSEACNSGMDHTCNVNDSAKSIYHLNILIFIIVFLSIMCLKGYEEVKLKHCWERKYNYYSSLQEAKAACTSDRNCIGVYDHGCKRNGYYLCPKGSMEDVWYANDIKSCVHAKEGSIYAKELQFSLF